jgi:ubiquitin-conjugating enzyme E2 J1
VNREICLSISGHHEETWQPAWGIRTALVALRSFMDTDVKGQVGGLQCEDGARREMARVSRSWKCATCGVSNEALVEGRELQDQSTKEESVPDELRLAYREDLAGEKSQQKAEASSSSAAGQRNERTERVPTTQQTQGAVTTRRPRRQSRDACVDKVIYAITGLLAFMIARKLLSFVQ